MFSSFDSMFVFPVCYHPVTLIAIDDDPVFLENLAMELSNELAILCFHSAEEAIAYALNEYKYLPFSARCLMESEDTTQLNFPAIRQELYNANRFREHLVCSSDYDMPGKTGIDVINTMEFPRQVTQFSHIILTGKASPEFFQKLATMPLQSYLKKDDPDYAKKLVELVKLKTERIFQWLSYVPARILSRNPNERCGFLFDGNFSPIFNDYIAQNNITEFYLSDRQGSFVFLDQNANLSWLIVRNELGIRNSLQTAEQYGAPTSIIQALKSREFVCSLYHEEHFRNAGHHIDWEAHLLPAHEFRTDHTFLNFFPGLALHNTAEDEKYYYAFTDTFPANGLDRSQILSYRSFLESS